MASGIRWTTEEFIEQCRFVHGDKYDYHLVKYTNNKAKVKIICRVHGPFEQLAQHHMRGRGCSKCVADENSKRFRSNTQEFIKKAKKVHGELYDYSSVVYITSGKKIFVICRKHGDFFQTPSDHLSGYGCPECGKERNVFSRTKDTIGFVEQAKEIHGELYDYSLVKYIKAHEVVSIICDVHGRFEQKPAYHLQGQGCPKCGGTKRLTRDEFIQKAIEIHGDKYDYSQVKYINGITKIKIICPRHGIFEQAAQDHLGGHGCQLCYSSTGEERIAKILTRWGVRFIRQKRFDKCKNKYPLPFDFYFQIGKYHILLEYDGGQHFQPVEYFGGIDRFEEIKRNDEIKNRFAQKYNFILIRIPYNQDDNLEAALRDKIEKHINQLLEIIAPQQHKVKSSRFNPTRYKQASLL